MNCPACKKSSLVPVKLEQGLPAMGCSQCNGALISLLYYRDWTDRNPEIGDDIKDDLIPETEESHAALHCPKCGRIMTKYRMSSQVNNRLDVCSSCDEAWLDNGEWTLLKALQLSQKLPGVLSDAWQLKVKQESYAEERKKRFLKLLGEADLERAEHFREWLAEHPKRQDILLYICHS